MMEDTNSIIYKFTPINKDDELPKKIKLIMGEKFDEYWLHGLYEQINDTNLYRLIGDINPNRGIYTNVCEVIDDLLDKVEYIPYKFIYPDVIVTKLGILTLDVDLAINQVLSLCLFEDSDKINDFKQRYTTYQHKLYDEFNHNAEVYVSRLCDIINYYQHLNKYKRELLKSDHLNMLRRCYNLEVTLIYGNHEIHLGSTEVMMGKNTFSQYKPESMVRGQRIIKYISDLKINNLYNFYDGSLYIKLFKICNPLGYFQLFTEHSIINDGYSIDKGWQEYVRNLLLHIPHDLLKVINFIDRDLNVYKMNKTTINSYGQITLNDSTYTLEPMERPIVQF